MSLIGPGGLLNQLTKNVLERRVYAELTERLCHEHGETRIAENIRNGTQVKTVLTESGPAEMEAPRDRNESFEPVIAPMRKRRLDGSEPGRSSWTRWCIVAKDSSAHPDQSSTGAPVHPPHRLRVGRSAPCPQPCRPHRETRLPVGDRRRERARQVDAAPPQTRDTRPKRTRPGCENSGSPRPAPNATTRSPTAANAEDDRSTSVVSNGPATAVIMSSSGASTSSSRGVGSRCAQIGQPATTTQASASPPLWTGSARRAMTAGVSSGAEVSDKWWRALFRVRPARQRTMEPRPRTTARLCL